MMNKNRKFQLVWSGLVKNLYPKSKSILLKDHFTRMKKQIELARSFGKIKLCILGDSNAENLSGFEYMSMFDPIGLSINLALSGTRADHWIDFFQSREGSEIKDSIQNCIVVWNIGGNHILQKRMDNMEESLTQLHTYFPESFNCLLPPIWSKFMHFLGPELEINHQLNLCNKAIFEIWKEKTIDTHTPFVNWEQNEPYVMVHKDLVHFSDIGNRIRIPIIIAKVYFKH